MRYFRALACVGAVVFILDEARGQETPYSVIGTSVPLSDAALMASTTAEGQLVVEPFVPPMGPKGVRIVSGFGKRDVMVQVRPVPAKPGQPAPVGGQLQAKSEMHEGVDYGAAPGTVVRASRSGRVIFAGFSKMYVSRNDKNEQHRLVIVRHSDGQSTRYVHLNALRVRPGVDVQAGQPLGVVAESDEGSRPVLHFEIRSVQGQAIDPETLMMDVPK